MRIVDFDVALPQTPLRRLPTPLVLPAIGLGAGIALDNLAPLPLIATAGALFAACGLALIARWQPRAWAAAVVLASVALGAARHDLAMRRWPADHVARFVGAHPILGTIRGLVIDAPVTYEPLATATRAYDVPGRTRLRIDARTWIDTAGGRHPATGRVLVYLTPATADLQPGDEIEVFGLVSRIAGPANPGEFDRRLYLARDGVWVALSANTREAVSLVARPSHSAWRRWLRNLRLRLAATLRETGDGAADEAVGSVLDAASSDRSTMPSKKPATRICSPPAG
jgi:hypothetical protein